MFEKMMNLRLFAAAIYDRAKLKGLPLEEMQRHLEPVIQELRNLILHKAETDVVGCIEAMAMFENLAKAHQTEAERHIQKAQDSIEYVEEIKAALIDQMRSKGQTQIRIGDHMVILNVVNGKDYLTYR